MTDEQRRLSPYVLSKSGAPWAEPAPEPNARQRREQQRKADRDGAFAALAYQDPRRRAPSIEKALTWAMERVGDDLFDDGNASGTGYTVFDRDARVGGRKRLIDGRLAPKCNFFVADALAAGGRSATVRGGEIPRAGDWYDLGTDIGGYEFVDATRVDQLQPGDIISDGHHVGVYAPIVRDGRMIPRTISAGTPFAGGGGPSGKVLWNDWAFRERGGSLDTGIHVRRYQAPVTAPPTR